MKTWSKCCPGLAALLGLTPHLWAQVPAPPAVAPPAAAPTMVFQAAPAPPKGLLEQCADLKAKCKEAFCMSPFGALLNNALLPVGAISGGLVTECCPTGPSLADLAKPPDSAEGAAAQIKKSEAEAKARRAAVRYLGTVDCHWFPEAEAALVKALRGDTNECVRLEAAISLGQGCCCTKKTIAALMLTVSGSNKDGKPAENSERVKAAAMYALQHCLACYSEEVPVEKITEPPRTPVEPPTNGKPLPPTEKPTAMLELSPYYKTVENTPLKQLIEEARRVLAEANKNERIAVVHRGEDHSLYSMIAKAMNTPVDSGTILKAMNPPADSGPALTETKPPVLAASLFRPEKPSTAAPPPAVFMSSPEPSPMSVSDPKSLSASTSSTGQSWMVQGRSGNPSVDSSRMVVQADPPRPTSLVGWLKSRQSAGSGSVEGPPVQAVIPEPKPVPAVQPVVQPVAQPVVQPVVQPVAKAPAAPAQPVAKAPAAPAQPAVVVRRVEENRDSEFPLPGATKVTLNQLLAVLRKAPAVEQREWAANNLATVNWHENPGVSDALLKTARDDAAANVRLASVRSLMKMGVCTPSAMAVFQALKYDADSRVRLEAEAALKNPTFSRTGSSSPSIIPASANTPIKSK